MAKMEPKIGIKLTKTAALCGPTVRLPVFQSAIELIEITTAKKEAQNHDINVNGNGLTKIVSPI